MEAINDAVNNFLSAKEDLKNAKEELNDALKETAVYRGAFDAAMTAPDVADKDAEKHALAVALKHYTKKNRD